MYNQVILLGRITHDLELKTSTRGTPVLSFSVACERQYTPKGEEKKTDFFRCIAWRQTAEFITRFFGKGKPIFLVGELQNRSYEDKDGSTKYITEVIVSEARFTGAKKDEETGGNNAVQQAPAPEQNAGATVNTAADIEAVDEEYPF